MNSDVKKRKEDSTLRKLSLKDLQRIRGAIREDLFAAVYSKYIKI